MPLHLDNLRSATGALRELLRISEDADRMAQLSEIERIGIRAGVIQHFEVAYEISWKLIQRWLNVNVTPGIANGIAKKQLYRLAAEHGLIADVEAWQRHHKARNATSHIYDGPRALRVYQATLDFAGDAERLLAALEARND